MRLHDMPERRGYTDHHTHPRVHVCANIYCFEEGARGGPSTQQSLWSIDAHTVDGSRETTRPETVTVPAALTAHTASNHGGSPRARRHRLRLFHGRHVRRVGHALAKRPTKGRKWHT